MRRLSTLIGLALTVILIVCPVALAQVQEYDVIVVGGGGAGLIATTAAAEQGVDVLLLERLAFLGGNTLISGGVMNVANPEWQKALGIEDSVDLHYEQTLAGGDFRGDPELVRTLVEGALPALHRTIERGLKFDPKEIFVVVGALWPRTHRPTEPAGTGWIRAYSEAAKAAGAEIRLKTRVVEILRESPLKGRVYGVKAVTEDGKEIEIRARRGVVLATGGFGANVELRMLHNPQLGPHIPTTNQPGAMGDGIIMAQDVGAATRGMDFIQLLPLGDPATGELPGFITSAPNEVIYVNKQGKRFVNEGARRDVLVNALFEQEDSFMFMISDSQTVRDPAEFGMPLATLLEQGRVVKADTLTELAEKIGVPAQAFEETVRRYNESVINGVDPDFGKTLLEYTLDKPPFYASGRVPSVHHTMGGVAINTKAQVIDRRGDPIPGLYAAGEVTGGIHGTNRLGGNAIADIAVFGWIAGESAATDQ
ncbi:MAG: flavocytochrome c [Limnochordia bacterium]|jgi:urocanate reductase